MPTTKKARVSVKVGKKKVVRRQTPSTHHNVVQRNVTIVYPSQRRVATRTKSKQATKPSVKDMKDLAIIQALTKPSQPASSSGTDQNISALQATVSNIIQSQNNLRPTPPPAPIAPLVERVLSTTERSARGRTPPARELRSAFLDRFRTPVGVAPPYDADGGLRPPRVLADLLQKVPEPQNDLAPPTTEKKKGLFSRAVGSLASRFTGSAPTTATKPVAKKATPSTSPPKAPTRTLNDRSTLNFMSMSPRGYSPLSSEEDVFEPVGVQPTPLRFLGANPLSETVPRPPLTQNELQELLPSTLSPNTVEKYRVADRQKEEMVAGIKYVPRKSDRKREADEIMRMRDPSKINALYQQFARNIEQGRVTLASNVASRRGGGGVNELTPLAITPPRFEEKK
jgi:hypothetical protein